MVFWDYGFSFVNKLDSFERRKKMKCEHRRIKENFTHGRKSRSIKYCRDCKKVVTNHDIMLVKRDKKQNERKRR